MQVFNFNRLSKGRSIFLRDIALYLKSKCFITVGKYSAWANETLPPPVTDFTATDEIILYKRPRLIMLATATNCGGIACDNKRINDNNYYLVDPSNEEDVLNADVTHIYIEGDIRYTDYTSAYFRTTSIVLGAEAPNNNILFKPEQMLKLGYVYSSINHTRIVREDNQRHLIKQLISI